MRDLVLIGGGEHARSVVWAAAAAGMRIRGFLDPQPAERTAHLMKVKRLGSDDLISTLSGDCDFVLGIGAIGVSPTRRQVAERAEAAGARFVSVIHPGAQVAPSAELATGAVVFAGAIVGPGARIGAHAVVNTSSVVEHDCEIEAFAQLGPGAVLGGGARIGVDAFVALGARVRDHVRIGARALVAMGAVVVRDVPDDASVFGVPARRRDA